MALQKIDDEAFELVIAIAVVGIPQKDHKSGLCHNTLHPCDGCREMLDESLFIRDNTVVLMAHQEHWTFDIHFVKSLLLEHSQ